MESSVFTKQLRRNQTPEEKVLWFLLKDRKLNGFKFRRQAKIGEYSADFCCFEKKLIIELDGGNHKKLLNKENDFIRTKYLRSLGFVVLRFWNSELNNQKLVLEKIRQALLSPSSVNPAS